MRGGTSRLISMRSEVEPVRRIRGLGWMLLAAGAVGGATGALVTRWATSPSRPTASAAVPAVRCFEPTAEPVDVGLRAQLSQRTRTVDEMSPDSFTPDASADEIYELEIDAPQPIRHIYVINDGQGLQWDTVIGREQITYKQRWSGHEGAETWHLGVRENGEWVNAPDGQIRGLGAGHHQLELVATSPQGYGPRVVAVQFADGTVRETVVR